MRLSRRLPFGKVIGNQGVGMAVAHAMVGLEERNKLHMFQVASCLKDAVPMLNGLTVLLLNGREIRCRPLNLGFACHD